MSILYKFLPKERTTYFENQLLRFSQPGALNDPYECFPAIDDALASSLLLELNARSAIPLQQLKGRPREERRKTERAYAKALSRENVIPKTIEDVRKAYTSKVVNGMNETVGIFSLSRRWNISLMWAHYTASHTGFCIGFDGDDAFFREGEDFFGQKLGASPVKYTPSRSTVARAGQSPDDLKNVLLTKADEWSYEEEERLIKMLNKADQTVDTSPFKLALFKVPHDSVSEVILGTNAPSSLIEEARKFAKVKGIPLYQTMLSGKTFALERRLLQP